MDSLDGNLQPPLSSGLFKVLPELKLFPKGYSYNDPVFDDAIRVVFFHEGHYSNDPDDPGGPTAYGWSLRAAQSAGDLDMDTIPDFDIDLDGDVDIDDIKAMDIAKAIDLYRLYYWERHRYNVMPPIIALKAFDLAVNMGAAQAHKLLQRSVRACGNERPVDDGIIGPKTLQSIRNCDQFALLAAYRSHAAGFYRLLAQSRPASRKYLNGWLNRAYF